MKDPSGHGIRGSPSNFNSTTPGQQGGINGKTKAGVRKTFYFDTGSVTG